MAKRSKKRSPSKKIENEPVLQTESAADQSRVINWRIILQILTIIAAGFWVYYPALHGNWLWDDSYLIARNPTVRDPYGIWNIWLDPGNSLIDFFPLTVSVDWLLWQIWPNDTFPFHLTNVILHIVSALLVWRVLGKLGLRLAWLGGLIFAIHPIMVESVAWMVELKNTLAMPPFLLAWCAWIDYDRRGKPEHYFLALGLFLVAMLCKTTMIMFPVTLLLYAWWRRGQVSWTDLKNIAPFFAVSLVIGLVLVHFEHFGIGGQSLPLGGFFSRLACAGMSISFYFSKYFLPVDLLPMYPQWKIDPPSLVQFLPWPILAGAIYWLWSKRQSWGQHALLGLGFFLINLIPFIGFRPITFMRFSWVMDHFLYLPMLGLLGLTVAALSQIDSRLSSTIRPFGMGFVAIVMIALAIGSHRYAKIYLNQETLWTYTVERFPNAWMAHNDLGFALTQSRRLPEAQVQFEEALRINASDAEARCNLGVVFELTGHKAEAIEQYQQALQLDPTLESARLSLDRIQNQTAPGNGPITK